MFFFHRTWDGPKQPAFLPLFSGDGDLTLFTWQWRFFRNQDKKQYSTSLPLNTADKRQGCRITKDRVRRPGVGSALPYPGSLPEQSIKQFVRSVADDIGGGEVRFGANRVYRLVRFLFGKVGGIDGDSHDARRGF